MKRKGIEVIITFKKPMLGSFKAEPRVPSAWEQVEYARAIKGATATKVNP